MIIPPVTKEDFTANYIGDPKFLKEAYEWYLIGRLEGNMNALRTSENDLRRMKR